MANAETTFLRQINRFYRPAADDNWQSCCMSTDSTSAQDAFAILYNTMGVFDYYDSSDVKARHRWAYDNIKLVIADFERAYQSETGISIAPNMQNAWRDYMHIHMNRVVQFATYWLSQKLSELGTLWTREYLFAAATFQVQRELFASDILDLIYIYGIAINSNQLYFDTSIFT